MALIHVKVTLRKIGGMDASYWADLLVGTGTTGSVAPVGWAAYEFADGPVHAYPFGAD